MKNKRAMYVIDEDYKLLYLNKCFKELYPNVRVGETCYEVLGRIDHPCKKCPKNCNKHESVFYNNITKEWISTKCCDMEWEGKENCTANYFIKWGDKKYIDTIKHGKVHQTIKELEFENQNQGIIACNYLEGFPIFYANNRFLEILGFKDYDQFIDFSEGRLMNLLSDDEIKRSELYNQDLIKDGMSYNSVYEVKSASGEFKKVYVKGKITSDDDDELIIISQIADLSDEYSTYLFLENEKQIQAERDQLIKYIDEVFPGGYFRCKDDEDYSLIEVSYRFLDITGFTKDEINTKYQSKFINLIHPEDLTILENKKLDGAPGKIYSFTYRIRHKSKGFIWVNNTTRCVELNGERYFQNAILDVTDEVEKKFELEKQNLQLNIILGNLPGGFNICYNDGKSYGFVYVSKELATLFGYTVDELLELTSGSAKSLIAEEDLDVEASMKEQLKKNGDYKIRYRVKCKDGYLRTVIDYGQAAYDKFGKPILYSFLLDITEEEENKELIELQNKLLERERERAFEREQSIQSMELIQALAQDFSTITTLNLDTMEVGLVYSEDPLHTEEEMNEYYRCHLYDEATDAYIRDYVYLDDKKSFSDNISIDGIRRNMMNREIFTHNYRKDVNGVVSYYQIKIVRLKSFSSGNVIMGYKNVDERTREMMHQKEILSDALADAQYANRAKTTFLSNMSHDIRTPMNAIIGYTTLASNHLDSKEKVRDYLKKISQSSNHLLSLINDVLDMSRIESGKIRINNQPEVLSDVIHNVRNIIQSTIQSRRLELYIDAVNVKNEYIYCDKLRINQILINLLSNSMKFTNPGGYISLRIIQHEIENNKVHFEFIVKDTGIGMSSDFVKHIFEPFVREKTSTVSGIQGTGLGMSITKSIIDMLGGSIRVESEVNKGTTFYVDLRFELQDQVLDLAMLSKYNDARALVVDNDMNTCESVSLMLNDIGMRAGFTNKGSKALELIKASIEDNDPYRLYVIDWIMPKMDGIELAREIRKIANNDAPILILTAYDWADIEDEAIAAGVTGFLSKPLFISDLKGFLANNKRAKKDDNEEISINERFIGKRLLLAEDNLFNQEIAKEILEGFGFKLEIASNGKEAVEALLNNPIDYFDAVLMDIQMPIMDGYEACSKIRGLANDKLKNIPIVAMTANAFLEDKERAIAAGMNGFISKPISVNKLVAVLNKLM